MSEKQNADLRDAVATRQLENDHAIVTEWRFAPGAHTGWHVHEYDYIVVPMSTGNLQLIKPDSESTSELVTGQSYAGTKGTEHDVINANDFEFTFIEIELKL